jgi:hypothetical protein
LTFFYSLRKTIRIVPEIKTFIKIDTFFLFFYYLIYFFPYQLYVLGLKSLEHPKLLTYLEYTNKSIILSTIGLLAFQIGFNYYKSEYQKPVLFLVSKRYMRMTSFIILFFITLILLLFYNTGAQTIFIGAYAGSKMGTVTYDAIFSLVSYFIILGIICGIIHYKIFKKGTIQIYIIYVISALWMLALLFIGDRNTFFLIGIVAFSGFFTFIKSISRKRILFYLIISLFLYQIIEISRAEEDKSLETFVDAFTTTIDSFEGDLDYSNSFDITTTGLRSSLKIIDEKNYYFGKFKLISLASIIPYSSRLIVDNDEIFTGTSSVLKEEMIGLRRNWGVGTNIISDCFLDFGLLGVIIILFYFGKFGGYLQFQTQNNINSPKWIFLYIICLSYYSEMARYGFDFPLRSIVWTYFLFFTINKVMKMNPKSLTI